MNIHPSRLCRIPPSFLNPTPSNSNSHKIYDRLPINCVIVRFSDQTIRIHPSQYQLLDSYYQFHNSHVNIHNNNNNNDSVASMNHNHVTTPKKNLGGTLPDPTTATATTHAHSTKISSPMSPKNPNIMNLSMNGSFFEDDVFHALDNVTPNPVVSQNSHVLHRDASNHLTTRTTTHDDNDRQTHGDGSTATNVEEYDEPEPPDDQSRNQKTIDKLSFLSLLDSKGNFEIAVGNHVDEPPHDSNGNHYSSGNSYDNDTNANVNVLASDTRNEIDKLETLIQREIAALSCETQQLTNDITKVRLLMDQIRIVEEQNAQIRPVLYQVQMQGYRDQFILEAQQIRLIRDVARIYPITVVRNVHYYIHGLEIPFDLYSGMVSEEVISAAFGFLCHTTFLISKYLGIHVRYRLHCQSSRSAIQDTNGSTYPLFPGRQVEREQFEYGVHLLHRNIDCICKCRGIQQRFLQPSNPIHILAKILRIYDNVNDGY